MSLRGVGFVLQCYLMLAAAMYFDLGEQEEKCIIEEIPEDMLVTGYFLLEPWDMKVSSHSPHFGVTVTVLISKRYGKFSKFTFTAHASGQHYLCFQTNSTRFAVFAGERLKLHLDVQMGEHSIDPKTDKTKNNMEVLENSLRHLADQMIYITRQQQYERRDTKGLHMSYWICCNSCFLSPSADRKLAVTTCGHVICSVCYGKVKRQLPVEKLLGQLLFITASLHRSFSSSPTTAAVDSSAQESPRRVHTLLTSQPLTEALRERAEGPSRPQGLQD
ncbi:Transmembrane emp24 domain-containing protein 11 [Liparis tanakae]|uniref:Transmembrane emp24 domain-containing protein 11 n=1 Tax=Liparis tanakae TaxID=230148 RepID=A0A4Z2IDP4_9TELE|nr:Transmembrane emp24 domain-containing protein 11 [Liparis tanakae]